MKTRLKSELEAAMAEFLENASSGPDWPNGLVHRELAAHMTNAAEAVFDATFASSLNTENDIVIPTKK